MIRNGKLKDKYILDIDLDYFHTKRSIVPSNPKTFYQLIQGAEIITIAKESSWINEWAKTERYDKELTVDYLLNELLNHINVATK
ncbi:MAG: hypothetical protein GWP19_12520 [Planctomycetia bacterium]|nr:hypothetical protein [Planctomycetia bacterium]